MKRKTKKRGGWRVIRHPSEVRAEALALLDHGDLTAEQVAASYGVSTRTLINWRLKSEALEDATPLTGTERREIKRLKSELAAANLQLEILKKLHAFSLSRRP
jgi:transposase-like protein